MGLCKCPKRKVTNLFCFEHDVNVCEYCLVADHERCIVQSYVQWLQDSDYNPICTLCNKLLKDEPTVRLLCYDVFHWSCLDKFASAMPATTAPAGFQCPKCKEGIFPSANQVSPVADALKEKLKSASWSRIGLGQSIIEDSSAGLEAESVEGERPDFVSTTVATTTNGVEDEKSDFVIVPKQLSSASTADKPAKSAAQTTSSKPNTSSMLTANKASNMKVKSELNRAFDPSPGQTTATLKHNRNMPNQYEDDSQIYDTSIGMVLNESGVDRDTGDYKYQRRPLFEWLSRWLKSRQISNKGSFFRMTRQKRNLFMILLFFLALFTLCVIMSRLSASSVDDNPSLDPMNNPNIRVAEDPGPPN